MFHAKFTTVNTQIFPKPSRYPAAAFRMFPKPSRYPAAAFRAFFTYNFVLINIKTEYYVNLQYRSCQTPQQ